MFTGTTDFPDTAVRIKSATLATSTILAGVLATAWPGDGTTPPNLAWTSYVYEYVLPNTVLRVLEVRDQEQPIPLYFEDELLTFDRFVPRPHDQFSDQPQLVMVGTEIESTFNTDVTTAERGMALKIYPTPENARFLNYSYIEQYADLTAAASTLTGVPAGIEDLIVELAYARALMSIGNDFRRGSLVESRVRAGLDKRHANMAGDPFRRSTLASLDDIHRAIPNLYRLPRSVDGP